MTALDQAFIKAFSQQGASLPVASASRSAVSPFEGRPAAKPLRSPVADHGVAIAPLPVSDIFRSVLPAIENPPLPPMSLPAVERPSACAAWEAEAVVGVEALAGVTQCFDVTERFEALPSAWVTGDEAMPPAAELPQEPEEEPPAAEAAFHEPAVQPETTPAVETKAPFAVVSAPPAFKPAWQVERFTWPKVCRRLVAQAGEEFDRLADALAAAVGRGEKVLAVGACSAGEGATTLLLCAARRLAERGVHLALVDADFSRPRLAKRLGIEPQQGWNEASQDAETFLGYAVIEAVSNNLALAPIRESLASNRPTADDWTRLAACLDALKNHYEMVLVDLGPLENIDGAEDLARRIGNGQVDAAILVHNGRLTSDDRLAEIQRELDAANIAVAGVIENFVSA